MQGWKMRFAFVFPGQGSQSVGMMNGFAEDPVVRATFAEASEILGQDIWQLAAEGPEAAQSRTVNTQPLMLTADVAIWRAWCAAQPERPQALAGHSLGEFAALVAADAMDFADALLITRFRAEAMQAAVPEGVGGMAAILGLDDASVEAACVEAAQGEVLEPANYNSPGQVVIAGTRAAVERGVAAAKARGAKRALLLPMSVPSHCSLMRDAAGQLALRLAEVTLRTPAIEVFHNCDTESHGDPEAIRTALVRQLHSPVRWVATLQRLANAQFAAVAECGPGKVLAPLCRRIDERLQGTALTDPAAFANFALTLKGEPK
jgi:[acyl-carrier-protein] S-malonyltransferase